jgi:hypothetical protein
MTKKGRAVADTRSLLFNRAEGNLSLPKTIASGVGESDRIDRFDQDLKRGKEVKTRYKPLEVEGTLLGRSIVSQRPGSPLSTEPGSLGDPKQQEPIVSH